MGNDIYQTAYRLGLAYAPEGIPLISLALPLALIGGGIDFLVNFFEDIFSGGSSPEIPRQLRHGRHPLYPVLLGVSDGLTPTGVSAGRPQFCGDPHPCNTPPLIKVQYRPTPVPGAGLTEQEQDMVMDLATRLTVPQAYELYRQGKLTDQEFLFFLLLKQGPAPTPTPAPPPGELALGPLP